MSMKPEDINYLKITLLMLPGVCADNRRHVQAMFSSPKGTMFFSPFNSWAMSTAMWTIHYGALYKPSALLHRAYGIMAYRKEQHGD